MRLPSVDYLATSGSSWLHRASIADKVSLPIAGFGVAAVSSSPLPLVTGYAVLMAVAWSASLPVARIALATILPVPMVGLYAFSHWQGEWSVVAVILAKGMVTVEASLLLMLTTPAPDLLAGPTQWLPAILGNSLVLTYRAVFTLWDRLASVRRAIQVRGGIRHRRVYDLPWDATGTPWVRLPQVGGMIVGMAIIRAIDLGNTYEDALRLRGYRGLMHPTRREGTRRMPAGIFLWGGCALLVGAATAIRLMGWQVAA
ncbi:MAG: energy-coupling factor transporter transmembrane protein EcfT [Chloroflexi bacterium]|nr:energy-coupling factor transporter transmembrane protein EcfT [Chloroflexota bacterium]